MSGPRRPFRTFLAVVVVVLLVALVWTMDRINREPGDAWATLHPGGRARALVVYAPGLSDFQRRVSRAFAVGLARNGWRVDLVTASRTAPTDLVGYDLVALGGPTYWWAPARPLQRYIGRLGDLHGKPTIVLLTGAGATERSLRIVEGLIRAHHGAILASHVYFTMAPNRESDYSWRTNRSIGVALAESAARALPAPRP